MFGEIQTGASAATQSRAERPRPAALWLIASGSSGPKGDVQELGWGFAVLQTFGNHTKSESLHASDGFIAVPGITHHARQGGHFGEPASVILPLNLDHKDHDCTVPSGRAVYNSL